MKSDWPSLVAARCSGRLWLIYSMFMCVFIFVYLFCAILCKWMQEPFSELLEVLRDSEENTDQEIKALRPNYVPIGMKYVFIFAQTSRWHDTCFARNLNSFDMVCFNLYSFRMLLMCIMIFPCRVGKVVWFCPGSSVGSHWHHPRGEGRPDEWGLTVFDSLIIRISWWDGSGITFLMCPIWWFYNHLCYPSFGHTVFLPHLDNQTRKSLAEILIGATRMKVGYWNAGTKRTLAYLEKIAMMPPLYSYYLYLFII